MYEYKVTKPSLPLNGEIRSTPIMDNKDMEAWLNSMCIDGWEFVSCGTRHWKGSNPLIQEWWIFRRSLTKKSSRPKKEKL